MMAEAKFFAIDPKPEDYWRAIILFGKNVACYKFALGKSLLALASEQKTIVTLEELSEPFSQHITEHLKKVDRQSTSPSSRFLNACRQFNTGELSKTQLIDTTIRLGFNEVIDAFHNLSSGETPVRFFIDERKEGKKGIVLTDELLQLLNNFQSQNLPLEVEARWNLVETAWNLNISRNLILYDVDEEILFTEDTEVFTEDNYSDSIQLKLFYTENNRRKNITSCRDALNGYQKGKCFYSFTDISLNSGNENLADVDHFFPLSLNQNIPNLNGVWNLVLSSQDCNRGNRGKFDKLPDIKYLERLHKRNEFLITSHHPLRKTLILQTGDTEEKRRKFLQSTYNDAQIASGTSGNDGWTAVYEHPATF
jgi:HNH endonuclease